MPQFILCSLVLLGGCSTSPTGLPADSTPCDVLCSKVNECKKAAGESQLPCAALCVYGASLVPGLAPTPGCSTVDAQKSCISAAVKLSCADYLGAATACATCPVLDGSACSDDADCQKYRPDYSCDSKRPGGYCTKACQKADSDCSAVGPEACAPGAAPSFDTQAPATQSWCLLGCRADGDCRAADGYSCLRKDASSGFGVCDSQ